MILNHYVTRIIFYLYLVSGKPFWDIYINRIICSFNINACTLIRLQCCFSITGLWDFPQYPYLRI